jgi:DNA-binding NtrC family response regulator
LENTVKNACVIAQREEIQVEDFRYKPELFGEGRLPSLDTPTWGGSASGLGEDRGVEQGKVKPLKEMEKEAIQRALEACNGKRKDASIALDIPIRTLYEKMKRYGIR